MRPTLRLRAAGARRVIPSRWVRLSAPTPNMTAGRVAIALDAWRTTLWFGLVVGFGEISIIAFRSWLHDESTPGHLQLNRHAAWMIPAANIIVFAAFGILPATLAGLNPRVFAHRVAAIPAGLSAAIVLWMNHWIHAGASVALAWGIAWRLQAALPRQPRRLEQLVGRSFPVLIALFGIVVVGDAWFVTYAERRVATSLPPTTSSASNVLLIVLDTVRADRTSAYGYEKDTTPNLAEFARRGVTFDHARAPASWTLPTHASLLTGRWPFELSTRSHGPLDDTFPTLAEVMQGRGYETAGFVANTYFCNSWYGLSRGFMHYEDYPERDSISLYEILRNSEIGQRILRASHTALHTRDGVIGGRKDAGQINREFFSWLRDRPEPERPFFAFLNYYDAHDPYIVFDQDAPSLGIEPPQDEDLDLLRRWHTLRANAVQPEQRRIAGNAYDRCLSYLDHQLGRLFDELERSGKLANTTVIVTSDHGEQFGEHGIDLHGNSLYRPLVDVPLIIVTPGSGPSSAGARIRTPVTLRDVPATVVDLVGSAKKSPFPGRSLARFWRPGTSTDALAPADQGLNAGEDLILSETWMKPERNPKPPKIVLTPVQWGPMRSLVGEGHIYIRLGNGTEQLFDLEKDPGEANDLAGRPEFADLLARFRARLEKVGFF